MMMVLPISRKSYRCAVASSSSFPPNVVACTRLIRLGLSLNSRLFIWSVGLARMFLTLGAEYSSRVLLAMASLLMLIFVAEPPNLYQIKHRNFRFRDNLSYLSSYKPGSPEISTDFKLFPKQPESCSFSRHILKLHKVCT